MSGVAYGVALPFAVLLLLSALLKLLPLHLPHSSLLGNERTALSLPTLLKHPALLRAVAVLEVGISVGVILEFRRAAWIAAALCLAFTALAVSAVARTEPSSCGCMGALSREQSWRSVARAGLMAVSFLAIAAANPVGVSNASWLVLPFSAALAWWSAPELGQLPKLRWRVAQQMIFTGDCATTQVSYSLLLKDLRASSLWPTVAAGIGSHDPTGSWREGCWYMLEFGSAVPDELVVVALRLDPNDARVIFARVAEGTGETLERLEAPYIVSRVHQPELAHAH